MKKLFLVLVVIFITGASLFAWEPADLTKFPIGQDGKSWILNFGVGLSDLKISSKGDTYIPRLRLSLDKNIGIGDKKLPFFAGGIVSYSGHGYKDDWNDWYTDDIFVGGRFGYHFNWNVKNLDTYAVTTTGAVVSSYKDKKYSNNNHNNIDFSWGINLGVRYFISSGFGFWAETGFAYDAFNADIGLAFKF